MTHLALYLVRIVVTPVIADGFDGEDDDLRGGVTQVHALLSPSAEAAADAALDAFHGSVAINNLEDFDIEAEAIVPSAHARLALVATGLRLEDGLLIDGDHPALAGLFGATA